MPWEGDRAGELGGGGRACFRPLQGAGKFWPEDTPEFHCGTCCREAWAGHFWASFARLSSRNHTSTIYFRGMLWGLRETMQVKGSARCLALSACSAQGNFSYCYFLLPAPQPLHKLVLLGKDCREEAHLGPTSCTSEWGRRERRVPCIPEHA